MAPTLMVFVPAGISSTPPKVRALAPAAVAGLESVIELLLTPVTKVPAGMPVPVTTWPTNNPTVVAKPVTAVLIRQRSRPSA